jgi:pimeloyl-ACP methyl ester carboxylesterase
MRVILIIQILLCTSAHSQVHYGSNKGQYLNIYGTRIYYEEYGKGTPLLMLHGGWGNIADFSKCIPGLAKNYRLIIPDQPGNGRSEFADSALSYGLMANYFSKMLELLKIDSAYAIGWSDGGIVALMMGMHPGSRLKKILASGPNYLASALKKEIKAEVDMQTVDWLERNDTGFINWYKRLSPSGDWKRLVRETYKMWDQEQYFPRTDLQKIKSPVLLVFGDNDMYTLEHALDMYGAIRNCKLCVLPATHHEVFHERPEMIIQLAGEFFGK